MYRKTDLVLTPLGLRCGGRRYPCRIGRGGVVAAAVKREGDGGTPTGVHRITGCLYRADRMARPARWARAIGPRDLWSDDPADPAYNGAVRAPHPFSAERLRRADRLYDLVLVTDWNVPAVPGRGSAIFVHRWRRPGFPTAGCVALAPGVLRALARRLPAGARLVVPPGLARLVPRGGSA
jgi:L,D-peptidoglycan transpeptidase YkuD (ErfK/YbiS/YcfS/YnhG family)